MTQHSRFLMPQATYFFTVRLAERGGTCLTDHIDALRFAYAKAVQDYPVTCHAMVVLPDHMHAIWSEPAGAIWYTERWRRIKTRFAHAVTEQASSRPGLATLREPGLWQRRFQEHCIRSENEFRRAMEHCRSNPLRHGLVTDPDLWPYSSFARQRARMEAA